MKNIFNFIALIIQVSATIDLYISQEEVQRILGFRGDFFYIRDGIMNDNAIKYELEVPHTVDALKMTWLDKNLYVYNPSFYKMNITSGNSSMLYLNLNVKNDGFLPSPRYHDDKAFLLNMTCKPGSFGNFPVGLSINIKTITTNKEYELQFTFSKSCRRGTDLPKEKRNEKVDIVPPADTGSQKMHKTSVFYIAVGVVFSVLLLIATAVCYLHVRSMPRNNNDDNPLLTHVDGSVHNSISGVNNAPTKSAAIPEAVRQVRAEQQLKDMLYSLKEFSVRMNLLTIGNAMQEGSFGRTYMGTLISAESGEEFKVSIKTVTDHASPEQALVFLADACLLKRTTHHNVLSPMNICCDGNTPYVIFPYMNRGNLKNYLRLSRTVEPLSKPLTTRDIVKIALQLAHGLSYLSRRRVIHKDVATRNCVVDEELNVKIADNALSRDFFPGDYHCLGDNENRPVRWMASESLECGEFSPASDVWSYGVLLWELCSLAQTPYSSVDPFEMLSYLRSGLRLPQPDNCPDDFFTVMACCWALSPDDRPHFQQIIECLDAFLNKLNAFI